MLRNVGGYLVELLAVNGIDTVFGIPGVHNLELYRGLSASNMLAASRSSVAALIAAVRGNPSGRFCAAVCAA